MSFERDQTTIVSNVAPDVLSYPQRLNLALYVQEEFPGTRAVVLDKGDTYFEVAVKPPVERELLEEAVGRFVANRAYHFRR